MTQKYFLGKLTAGVGLLLISILSSVAASAQANYNPGNPYVQDFGTSAIASWTDNTTFLGWYAVSWKVTVAGTNSFGGTENITTAAPTNPGEWEVYQCNGGSDMKLGTRPSNGTGGPDSPGADGQNGIGLGLCLKNNFTSSIKSFKVEFDWFQLSLAENGNEANQNFFSYFISSSNLTGADLPNNAHTYTNVAAGNYTAPNNSATAGSNQISGYPGTVSGHLSFCFSATLPVNNYIMLRWWDPNNANNDPHMAIDNVKVYAYSDVACTTLLPVDLMDFSASQTSEGVVLEWETASESNNNYFMVQRSADGINYSDVVRIEGAGNSNTEKQYAANDHTPLAGTVYYKLRQVDYNGETKDYGPVAVKISTGNTWDLLLQNVPTQDALKANLFAPENSNVLVEIYDLHGGKIFEKLFAIRKGDNLLVIDCRDLLPGMYIIQAAGEIHGIRKKFIKL
ncbi:MAG TPA: hypothetical protein VII99_07175 [Bacteroidia bacterium]